MEEEKESAEKMPYPFLFLSLLCFLWPKIRGRLPFPVFSVTSVRSL